MAATADKPQPARRRQSTGALLKGYGLLAPASLWIALFFIVPLISMVIYSFWERRGSELITEFTTANYERFFGKWHFLKSLLNSLEVTGITVLISILLAYPLAYILAYKVPVRWQRAALILAVLPFWTSYLVRSYSWLLVLAENGAINTALLWLGIVDEPVSLAYNRGATVVGFVHFFIMLLTLTIYANLVQIPASYRLAATDLGASKFSAFLRITLPLSIPGVAIGAFLTFVITIGDFITPQILGGNKELLMPQSIMMQISKRANFPMATSMGLIMMGVITLVFFAFARWLKMERV